MAMLSRSAQGVLQQPARENGSWFKEIDLVLWGIPLALFAVGGILIASTQRQAITPIFGTSTGSRRRHGAGARPAVGRPAAGIGSRGPYCLPIYGLTWSA